MSDNGYSTLTEKQSINSALKRMQGRVALIIGGGTGIGNATATLFSQEGASVCVMGRRTEPLDMTVKSIQKVGGHAVQYVGDATDEVQVQQAIKVAMDTFGNLDCLVNCAGIVNRTEEVTTMTVENWNNIIDTNLKSVFLTTKFFIQSLLANNRAGTIVNISSISAHISPPGYATSSASKAAILAYTRVNALQYAPYKIRCNCVSPGIIHTPMFYTGRSETNIDISIFDNMHPLRRIGQPIDVANAVLFLSSQESDWITGQELIIDGGFSISG
jgi:NAD(P)-dependent dehydrogenase (short-subunit alcohol dehydrogenase family)